MFDERFHTPRASALSSRSNCSSLATARSHSQDDGTASSCERWQTPRASVSSSRSAASFATPRSTFQSPIEIQVHRGGHASDGYSCASDRDRTKDFRRFTEHPTSHRRPATAVESTYQRNYAIAEYGGVTESRHSKPENRTSSRDQRNQDIFSLARHGRVVSKLNLSPAGNYFMLTHYSCIQGELEDLLLQGVPIDSKYV